MGGEGEVPVCKLTPNKHLCKGIGVSVLMGITVLGWAAGRGCSGGLGVTVGVQPWAGGEQRRLQHKLGCGMGLSQRRVEHHPGAGVAEGPALLRAKRKQLSPEFAHKCPSVAPELAAASLGEVVNEGELGV